MKIFKATEITTHVTEIKFDKPMLRLYYEALDKDKTDAMYLIKSGYFCWIMQNGGKWDKPKCEECPITVHKFVEDCRFIEGKPNEPKGDPVVSKTAPEIYWEEKDE